MGQGRPGPEPTLTLPGWTTPRLPRASAGPRTPGPINLWGSRTSSSGTETLVRPGSWGVRPLRLRKYSQRRTQGPPSSMALKTLLSVWGGSPSPPPSRNSGVGVPGLGLTSFHAKVQLVGLKEEQGQRSHSRESWTGRESRQGSPKAADTHTAPWERRSVKRP